MKNSNFVVLAVVAVILLVLAVTAVHLNPALAGVIGAILLGIAAIITAINRHRPDAAGPDAAGPDAAGPDAAGPDAADPDPEVL